MVITVTESKSEKRAKVPVIEVVNYCPLMFCLQAGHFLYIKKNMLYSASLSNCFAQSSPNLPPFGSPDGDLGPSSSVSALSRSCYGGEDVGGSILSCVLPLTHTARLSPAFSTGFNWQQQQPVTPAAASSKPERERGERGDKSSRRAQRQIDTGLR